MRFVLPALLLSASVSIADIYVRAPVTQKETLLGTWEGVNGAEDGYLFRMVLAAGDKGYLIWPRFRSSESTAWWSRNRFFGRLQKLELKNGHLKLLFRRLHSERDVGDPPGCDAIEIDGRVDGLEGNDEMKDWAILKGIATARAGNEHYTYKIEMHKGDLVRYLDADARQADDELSLVLKPGPIGSRDDALAVLRKSGEIVEGTRIIAAEWNEDWRQWIVELQRPNGDSAKLAVDVPRDHVEDFVPDKTP